MKHLLVTTCAGAIAIAFCAPVIAATGAVTNFETASHASFAAPVEIDRKGRSKQRIPGGSGCDDPEDILEHPECSA